MNYKFKCVKNKLWEYVSSKSRDSPHLQNLTERKTNYRSNFAENNNLASPRNSLFINVILSFMSIIEF